MGEDYTIPLSQWYSTPRTTPSLLPQLQPRMFPIATANGPVAQPGFNYETDMAGLLPTSTPLGNTPTNAMIAQQISGAGLGNNPMGTPSFMDKLLGYRDGQGNAFQGWGGLAIGGAQALGGLYLGMKQYNLAKDSLAFQKDAFAKNFETQKNLTNAQLEDRQRARVASNSAAYQSVGDYMNKNGVK